MLASRLRLQATDGWRQGGAGNAGIKMAAAEEEGRAVGMACGWQEATGDEEEGRKRAAVASKWSSIRGWTATASEEEWQATTSGSGQQMAAKDEKCGCDDAANCRGCGGEVSKWRMAAKRSSDGEEEDDNSNVGCVLQRKIAAGSFLPQGSLLAAIKEDGSERSLLAVKG
ncbi:hypothetical protein GW17_00055017 [Ensete ventricosum]|nr:hypothetical protein GW17_00055017 [Ensete ventricosum]